MYEMDNYNRKHFYETDTRDSRHKNDLTFIVEKNAAVSKLNSSQGFHGNVIFQNVIVMLTRTCLIIMSIFI